MTAVIAASFPWGEAARCLDCEVVFSCRNRTCPKCGGDAWVLCSKSGGPVTPPQRNRAGQESKGEPDILIFPQVRRSGK